MHYKLSPRQIARCRCNDCGVNVIEAGDYCMLRPRIWRNTFGLGITDNLCLAWIERRLGRAITIGDVITFPIVDGYPMSDTLHARLFPSKKERRATTKKTKQLASIPPHEYGALRHSQSDIPLLGSRSRRASMVLGCPRPSRPRGRATSA